MTPEGDAADGSVLTVESTPEARTLPITRRYQLLPTVEDEDSYQQLSLPGFEREKLASTLMVVPMQPLEAYRDAGRSAALPPFPYFNPLLAFERLAFWYPFAAKNGDLERSKQWSIRRYPYGPYQFGKENMRADLLHFIQREQPALIRAYAPSWPVFFLSTLPSSHHFGNLVRPQRPPLIVSLHKDYEGERQLLGTSPVRQAGATLMERQILKRAEHIICVSHHLADYARVRGANPDKISVIPNRLDLPRFQKRDPFLELKIRKELRLNPREMVITFVGHFVPQKNPLVAIKAFALLRHHIPSKLLLISDGPLRRDMERLAQKLGIIDEVRFVGFIEDSELVDYLHVSDCFLCPSKLEGFGMSVVQAQAADVPIVASNIPHLNDIIDYNCAVLGHPDHPEDFARGMARVLKEKSYARHLASEGRTRVERFSAAKIEQLERDLYMRVMNSHAGLDGSRPGPIREQWGSEVSN